METGELLQIFFDEALDRLESWDQLCIQLEDQFSVEAIDALFREAHSLKGGARTVELVELTTLIHQVEDLISMVKKQPDIWNKEILALFIEARAVFSQWIQALKENSPVPIDVSDFILKLVEITGKKAQSWDPNQGGEMEFVIEGMGTEVAPEASSQIDKEKKAEPSFRLEENIRISKNKLDLIVKTIQDLAIHQAKVWHFKQDGHLNQPECDVAIDRCYKMISDLQNQALNLNQVSIHSMLNRLNRMARELIRSQSKEAQVHLSGVNVEVERSIAEKISDPLMHIIRNAIDHGLENTDEREKSGKPQIGNIFIEASKNTHGVEIRIRDDGRGMNPEQIQKIAIQKGLLNEKESLTTQQIYDLIFLPGFSTAKEVTDLSGRGVGMDVVRKSLFDLNGKIEIQSELGKGTTFIIVLPTHLSVMESLVVEVDHVKFAVPLQSLEEIIHLNESESSEGSRGLGSEPKTFQVRDETIWLERLSSYLSLQSDYYINKFKTSDSITRKSPSSSTSSFKTPSLVIAWKGKKIAFAVDRICDQQLLLVREPHQRLKSVQELKGVTLFADGEPGIVVDLQQVADRVRFDVK